MIIFDLDGTLANCEHRRHFIDGMKNPEYSGYLASIDSDENGFQCFHRKTGDKFKPDWDAFHEACDMDFPIISTINVFVELWKRQNDNNGKIQIWSGRCESVRKKTIDWLVRYLPYTPQWFSKNLKMRPIGDYTPDDVLKEKWLDEYVFEEKSIYPTLKHAVPVNKIDFVFDDRHKVVHMWRRRGIFVFDCNQTGEKF